MVAAPASHAVAEGGALRIVNVSKDFPAAGDPNVRTLALSGTSLSIAPGELVSIVGPSGCAPVSIILAPVRSGAGPKRSRRPAPSAAKYFRIHTCFRGSPCGATSR